MDRKRRLPSPPPPPSPDAAAKRQKTAADHRGWPPERVQHPAATAPRPLARRSRALSSIFEEDPDACGYEADHETAADDDTEAEDGSDDDDDVRDRDSGVDLLADDGNARPSCRHRRRRRTGVRPATSAAVQRPSGPAAAQRPSGPAAVQRPSEPAAAVEYEPMDVDVPGDADHAMSDGY